MCINSPQQEACAVRLQWMKPFSKAVHIYRIKRTSRLGTYLDPCIVSGTMCRTSESRCLEAVDLCAKDPMPLSVAQRVCSTELHLKTQHSM